MPYTKQTWSNDEGGGTPLNATRLNYMEDGIEDASPQPAVTNYFDRYSNGSPVSTGVETHTDITSMLDTQSNNGSPSWMPTWSNATGNYGPLFSEPGLYRMTYNIMCGGLATGLWWFRANYIGMEPGYGYYNATGAFSGASNALNLFPLDTLYIPAAGKIQEFTFWTTASVDVSYFELYISKLA